MSTVDEVVQRAAEVLNDPNHDRWTYSNMVEWVNQAISAICRLRPSAHIEKVDIPLIEGAIQALDPSYSGFVRGLYTKVGGSTPGKTPIKGELGAITLIDANWMSAASNDEIDEVMYDPETPHTFFVYPPQPAATTNTLYAEVGTIPPLSIPADTIPIPSMFDTAIVDYVLWRAYSMDAEHASQDGRAAVHYNTFKAAVLGR